MREFIRKWSLDDHSVTILAALNAEQSDQIMREFRPSRAATVDNFNPKFVSFCKSRTGAHIPYHGKKHGLGNANPDLVLNRTAPGQGFPNARDRDSVQQFCRGFGLDKRCEDLLLNLPLGVRQTVMQEFKPRKDQDPIRMFISFTRSRSSMENSEHHFIKRFNLDDQAKSFLYALEISMRKEVMETFAPKNPDGNMNPVFMSFAKSMRARREAKLGKEARGGPAPHDHGSRPQHPSEHHRSAAIQPNLAHAAGRRNSGGGSGSREVDRFVRQYDLDQSCEQELMKYDSNTQEILMKDFKPKDTSRNVSKLFLAYISAKAARATVMASQQGRTTREVPRTQRSSIIPQPRPRDQPGNTMVTGYGSVAVQKKPYDSHPHVHKPKIRVGEPIRKEYDARNARPVRVPVRKEPSKRDHTPPRRDDDSRRKDEARREERESKKTSGRRGSVDSEQMAVVKKFASRHKLNSKATSLLHNLSTEEQNMMMVHFDPDQRRETSNQFIALVERKTKRKVREADSPDGHRAKKVPRIEESKTKERRRR